MENLYNYVLHYNPFRKVWLAIPTKIYTQYFIDSKNDEGVLKAKNVNTLIDLIKSTK